MPSLIAAQMSAPVLSAPPALLGEENRWSVAPTVLGTTEPAESHTGTPNPAAPSGLVLSFGKNRKSLCVRTLHFIIYYFAFESHACSKKNVQRKRERPRQLGLVDLHQFRKKKDQPVAAKTHSNDSDSDWTPQLESHLRRKTK